MLQVVAHAAGSADRRSVGGPERRALASLEHWDYDRFRLVMTYSPEGRLHSEFEAAAAANPHIRLLPIPAPRRRDRRALPTLLRVIRAHGVDVVHSQGPHGADWWAAVAARLTGAGSVVTRPIDFTAYQWPPFTFRRFRLLDRLALGGTFRMVFVSEHIRASAIRTGEATPARSQVILNGVDLYRFAPRRDAATAGTPTFGMVAQLLPVKNWDMFLSACERIFAAVPESRALIVGDGPERDRIAGAIADRGWTERVTMTGFRTDIPDVLAGLDVLALTSLREGLPVSILEAMAMRKGVVATDVGGVREIVHDGRTGYLVPAGDTQAFADRVIRLLRDPQLRAGFGAAARAHVERSHSIEGMVRAYQTLYLHAARARGRAPDRELRPADA